MRDRELLIWLHERLEHVHGEKELIGYMHRLRKLIASTPEDRDSSSDSFSSNSLGECLGKLK